MDKNKVLKSNISYGVLWKGISLLFIYLTVPILLKYLGKEYYGVWVTIFTLLNAAYFMDMGIALGVKNKLTEAIAKEDFVLAKIYISTAYFSMSFIAAFMLILGFIFVLSFDMHIIFNTNIIEKELKVILLLSMALVFISIVLNIYKSLLNSFQKSAKVELAMALYQGFVFVQLLALPKLIDRSLVMVSLIYGATNIFIALIFTGIFFKKNKQLFPSVVYFKRNRIKEILGIGINFFIIQIALIIILTTDNMIITYLIGPEHTATYSIVNKVYQVFLMMSLLIFTPLWTLYTNAYYTKDFEWIKNTLRKLNYLFILLILILILLYFNFNWIIKAWIPETLEYSNLLLIFMTLFVLIKAYGDIYMTFLNSIGKIKLQMWIFIFAAAINIPLSIMFVNYFKMGISGVILATCISLFGLSIAMPIQAYKVLKKAQKVRHNKSKL